MPLNDERWLSRPEKLIVGFPVETLQATADNTLVNKARIGFCKVIIKDALCTHREKIINQPFGSEFIFLEFSYEKLTILLIRYVNHIKVAYFTPY